MPQRVLMACGDMDGNGRDEVLIKIHEGNLKHKSRSCDSSECKVERKPKKFDKDDKNFILLTRKAVLEKIEKKGG